MSRIAPRLVVLALACGLVAHADPARAGISYSIVFRSTGTDQVDFTSVADARAAAVVADLLFTTTDALIFNSVSVGWDDSFGLDVASAKKWSGLAIPGGFYGSSLGGPVDCSQDVAPHPACIFFVGSVGPPNGPPSLPPGTYDLGTVFLDTSAIKAGQSSVFPFLVPSLDATGAVLPAASNNIIDVTGIEVLYSGTINVIPEPGSALLLGLGLLGMVLARRRRSG